MASAQSLRVVKWNQAADKETRDSKAVNDTLAYQIDDSPAVFFFLYQSPFFLCNKKKKLVVIKKKRKNQGNFIFNLNAI